MADAEDVFTGNGAGLVMNRRGFERARIINVEKINLVISPCETFSMQNLGKPHSEVVHEYWSFMNGYPKDKVRVYISMAFGSPNCSEVTEKRMKMMLKDAALFGNTVVFSDTIGIGCTDDVHKWTRMARDENLTPALHLHHKGDESRPLQLIRAGLIAGITEFDSSIGGLGGCPFAKGSGANLSTETLVRHLNSWGIDCGLNEVSLGKAAKIAWKIKNTIAIAI